MSWHVPHTESKFPISAAGGRVHVATVRPETVFPNFDSSTSIIESGSMRLQLEASPQKGDLKLSGPPSGQGVGTRTRYRRVPGCRYQGGSAIHCATDASTFWGRKRN
ncbi:hypothetical protein PoB_006976400 [Plakobranchus ocellatus]|uniref:Uncharacterized protein n=1 Tax=Plakobranchus ocellatus TaxID=259542 RepID=A0AAV4DGV8_9GAST|nr:hypothetical protein PoB_006976400 [Plakobranchus ocellatus]